MRTYPGIFAFATALLLAAGVAAAQSYPAQPYSAQSYDPPLRVAHLSYAEGDVSFSPAGEQQWLRVQRNRPHSRGDRFWTNDQSRAELQLGAAVVRLDERTSMEILNLDDRYAQFELTQGTLNLHVRRLYEGQTYEIATPTLAFVVNEPGEYRIDVDGRGAWTEVVVREGNAVAYGDRSEFPLRAGDAIRFSEPTLRDYQVFRFPDPDGFDQFCELRNERLDGALALRYVPDDMIGYSDLDEYGTWSNVQGYGNVWYPTQVDAGWAPYRDGNWMWQEPWGWTWVDEAAWGFAPSHYGRWVNVDQRWGWIPTSRRTSAVYAPALVAFLGSGSAYSSRSPVGWFPLGPSDVYLPSYSASRDYFTRVNSGYRTINVASINNTYASYSSGARTAQRNYMYRNNRSAVTAVPADVFVGSRPVAAAVLPYDRSASALSEATHIARMSPTVQSVTGATRRASSVPDRAVESRRVIARRAPPPAAVPFEARRQALGRDPGRPLDSAAMEALRGQGRGRGADASSRQVRVVGAGTPVKRQQNEARDATRELERMRDPADDANAARAGANAERGQQGRGSRERDPAAGEPSAQETGRAAREAQRQAEDAERSRQQAGQEQARDQRQEAQRQQRDAEQAARNVQQQREQAERAAGEQRRAEQENQQAQREQQRQQREAEQAQRALQAERQQAQDAQREQQRQQREAEQAQRQAQQAQEQQQADAAREQERQAQAAQREQQRQQREAEQAQRQAQQQQQEAERAARAQQQAEQQEQAAQREQQRQQREAEQAERRLQQEQQQAAQRVQREQQQAAQQAEAAQRQAAHAQQQAQQQAEAAQREAERAQREAERAQVPAEADSEDEKKEKEKEGKGNGRFNRGRDGG